MSPPALEDYQRKRSFGATPEPSGQKRSKATFSASARPIFVVQLHHASHRHYDFRLQVGDTLRSWAVPKGPSFDPSVKRMAVEVEDHPLDYASFEGDIPKGHYGGGHVALFDRGIWTTEGDVTAQLAKGHLRFDLHGDKLKGGWHLVRSGKPARQPQWLLFKQDDAWASPHDADDLLEAVELPPAADAKRARKPATAAKSKRGEKVELARTQDLTDWKEQARTLPRMRTRALPATPPKPQLAKLTRHPPEGDGWLHELKWDGYRMLCTIRKSEVRLWSRNALEWTDRVPEVRDAVASLGLQEASLDGELIAGQGTREDFNLLQQVLSGERQGHLRYVVFDILNLQGQDLHASPLVARKALLETLLAHAPSHLGYSSHGVGHAANAFTTAVDAGYEGIISKRADSAYHAGRGDDWRKAKAQSSEEFAVIGFTPPKGSRVGVGSLLLAAPDAEHGWAYAGRVGSGFSDAQLQVLAQRMDVKGSDTPSVHVPGNNTELRHARWLPEPAFVVEVFTRGTGARGLLRQASFKALRADKDVASLAASVNPSTSTKVKDTPPMGASTRSTAKSRARTPSVLTSPGKVLFPGDGITKAELAEYYSAVMDWLLTEIVGRPLSLVRCPAGIGAQCFFRNMPRPALGWCRGSRCGKAMADTRTIWW